MATRKTISGLKKGELKQQEISLRERVRDVLEDEGVVENRKQSFYAKKLGVSPPTIKDWIEMKKTPGGHNLGAICKEFGLNVEWLFYGRGEKKCEISRSVVGNGNTTAIGGNAHASSGSPGEINRRQYNSNAMLNQMEREFIEGMRRHGRLSDWAECFDILERAKLKQIKIPTER